MKLFILFLIISTSAFAVPVKIKFDKFQGKTGKIYFLVFNDPRYFPDQAQKAIKAGILTVTSSSLETTIDLPVGDYAITTFLDENNNAKLDTNMMGIPKERFGFSNNPTILTGAPSFQECEFTVSGPKNIVINLLKLF